nr:hypothetical protein [uncultured Acetatifactor sp.]
MTALILVITSAVLWWSLYSARPFETINVDDIEEITVYAIPPEKEIVLSKDEVERVIPLLQNLKISKPGYKILARRMGGQTAGFIVQKSDGSTIEIFNFGNVIITIDNKSYQADYESAEAINAFANKVLGTGF